jgi:hypothetical protein
MNLRIFVQRLQQLSLQPFLPAFWQRSRHSFLPLFGPVSRCLLFTLLLPAAVKAAPDDAATDTVTDTATAAETSAADSVKDPVPAASIDEQTGTESNTDSTTPGATPPPSLPPPIPRVRPNADKNRDNSVIRHLQLTGQMDQQVQLVADEQVFSGRFLQESSGRPQGAALILHDNGQHLLWPRVIAPLQEQLPEYGWATLSIDLPEEPARPLPKASVYAAKTDQSDTTTPDQTSTPDPAAAETINRQTATDNNPATDSSLAGADPSDKNKTDTPPTPPDTPISTDKGEPPLPEPVAQTNTPDSSTSTDSTPPASETVVETDPAETYAERQQAWRNAVMARLYSAVRYLNSRGQYNLALIVSGSNSSWAIQYLQENTRVNDQGEAEKGLVLILVQANNNPAATQPLTALLPTLKVPVLDIISNQYPANLPRAEIEARAGAMRHERRNAYRQYELTTIANETNNPQLVRLVRGWLKTHAAGTELGRR